jgi:hypothetical protein
VKSPSTQLHTPFQYSDFIDQFVDLHLRASGDSIAGDGFLNPGAGLDPLPLLLKMPTTKSVLIVAPHPDDECLMAGLPLRMLELGHQVHVLPFSLGSRKERQEARSQELDQACKVLGFHRVQGEPHVRYFQDLNVGLVLSPHANDVHPTHVRAHDWVRSQIPLGVRWVKTQYWGQMAAPSHLISLHPNHVALMGSALLKHVGEVSRHPYHLSLPSYLREQVRIGAELISGMGSKAVQPLFGQLIQID